MPSLHFGWALVIAWAVLLATRSRWRYLVLAHPLLTLAAIVLTANHYWLDAVVATFLFGVALGVDRLIERRREHRLALRVAVDDERAASSSRRCARPAGVEPAMYRPRAAPAADGSSTGCSRRTHAQG